MTSGNPWVIASSAFFFIPAILALFRQSLVVAIIYFNAAIFSTLYHVSDQKQYAELDVIWASLAILISLVMLAVISLYYAPWNWRVFLPFMFGISGLIVYFVGGQCSDTCQTNDHHYVLYHSLWHLFIGLAGLAVVWTPVKLQEAQFSYGELYLKIYANYNNNRLNEKSFLR